MTYIVKSFKENEIGNCGIDTDKIIDIVIRHYPKLDKIQNSRNILYNNLISPIVENYYNKCVIYRSVDCCNNKVLKVCEYGNVLDDDYLSECIFDKVEQPLDKNWNDAYGYIDEINKKLSDY